MEIRCTFLILALCLSAFAEWMRPFATLEKSISPTSEHIVGKNKYAAPLRGGYTHSAPNQVFATVLGTQANEMHTVGNIKASILFQK